MSILCGITILVIVLIILILLIGFFLHYEIPRYLNACNATKVDLNNLDYYYRHKEHVTQSSRVVITLTTIPDRIDKLIPCLYSLLSQTKRVDCIYINVPYISLKGKAYRVPKWLNNLHNIKIRRVIKDWGPSCKLLPTAQVESSDTNIIVVDDDIIYGSRFVESITYTFNLFRGGAAITNYGSIIGDSTTNTIYNYLFNSSTINCPHKLNLLFGCGGYMLRNDMLPSEVFDYKSAPKEVVYVDDNWISGWLTVNNINIYSMGSKWKASFLPSPDCFATISLSSEYNSDGHNAYITNNWFRSKGIW